VTGGHGHDLTVRYLLVQFKKTRTIYFRRYFVKRM